MDFVNWHTSAKAHEITDEEACFCQQAIIDFAEKGLDPKFDHIPAYDKQVALAMVLYQAGKENAAQS